MFPERYISIPGLREPAIATRSVVDSGWKIDPKIGPAKRLHDGGRDTADRWRRAQAADLNMPTIVTMLTGQGGKSQGEEIDSAGNAKEKAPS